MYVDPEVIEEEECGSCIGRLREVWPVRANEGERGG